MPSKNTKKKLKQAAQNQRAPKTSKLEAEVLNAEDLALKSSDLENKESLNQNTTSEKVLNNSSTANVDNVENSSKVTNDTVVSKDEKNSTKSDNVKDSKKKKSKKEPGRMKKKTKEVFSELKKVTWPTFGQVMKKTGTVLVVVLCFAVVLLGIDTVLELAYNWFIGGLNA